MGTLLLFQSGFLLFLFLLWLRIARTSRTMLNNSGESGHPCLIPDLRGNAFSFSLLRIIIAVGLSYMAIYVLYYVEIGSVYAHFLKNFNKKNGCWILSKAFSASIEIIIWFYLTIFKYGVSHWLICIHWRILAFMEYSQLYHGVWTFWCVAQFCLLNCCWGFLHLCS